MKTALRTGFVLALLALVLPARAALFDDDEARKAIIDLREQVKQSDAAQNAKIDQINAQLSDQLGPLRRSLLDLNSQIEQLQGQIAKLQGQNEQLARDLSDTQRKLLSMSDSVDARFKPLEPQKVVLDDGSAISVTPDERSQYDAAMGQVKRGEFSDAAGALSGFLNRFPSSGYSDSVRFWLGNMQYALRNYKDAIATFKAELAANPQTPLAAKALLAMANCQIELKDVKTAKHTLADLIKSYPGTDSAQAGKERLAALR